MNRILIYLLWWQFLSSEIHCGIVQIAGPEEEAYALRMWRDMCLEGRRDFATDGNNDAVFCAMDENDENNPSTVQVVYPTITLEKARNNPGNQIIVIDPPSLNYNHKITVQGDSAPAPKTTIYVRQRMDKHRLEVIKDTKDSPTEKPTIIFLNPDGNTEAHGGRRGHASFKTGDDESLHGQGSDIVEQIKVKSESDKDSLVVQNVEQSFTTASVTAEVTPEASSTVSHTGDSTTTSPTTTAEQSTNSSRADDEDTTITADKPTPSTTPRKVESSTNGANHLNKSGTGTEVDQRSQQREFAIGKLDDQVAGESITVVTSVPSRVAPKVVQGEAVSSFGSKRGSIYEANVDSEVGPNAGTISGVAGASDFVGNGEFSSFNGASLSKEFGVGASGESTYGVNVASDFRANTGSESSGVSGVRLNQGRPAFGVNAEATIVAPRELTVGGNGESSYGNADFGANGGSTDRVNGIRYFTNNRVGVNLAPSHTTNGVPVRQATSNFESGVEAYDVTPLGVNVYPISNDGHGLQERTPALYSMNPSNIDPNQSTDFVEVYGTHLEPGPTISRTPSFTDETSFEYSRYAPYQNPSINSAYSRDGQVDYKVTQSSSFQQGSAPTNPITANLYLPIVNTTGQADNSERQFPPLELTASSSSVNILDQNQTPNGAKGQRRQRRKKQRGQQNIDPNGNATSSVFFEMDHSEMMHYSVRHPY